MELRYAIECAISDSISAHSYGDGGETGCEIAGVYEAASAVLAIPEIAEALRIKKDYDSARDLGASV